MIRRALVVVLVAAGALGLSAGPVAAKEIRVPVCDLDGHCDRHCVVGTDKPFLRCGYGP